MPKKVNWSSQQSSKNILADNKSVQKSFNALWSVANKSPLFLRKPKFVGGAGKNRKRATMVSFGKEIVVPQKTNRCTRRHSIRVMLSAAGAECAAQIKAECQTLRNAMKGERAIAPLLPSIQQGAELLIEQAIVAYSQTIFDRASRMRESLNMHKKVTTGCMQAAIEITNKQIAAATSITPGVIVTTPRKNKAIRKHKMASAVNNKTMQEE
jgi:hypothetical protein